MAEKNTPIVFETSKEVLRFWTSLLVRSCSNVEGIYKELYRSKTVRRIRLEKNAKNDKLTAYMKENSRNFDWKANRNGVPGPRLTWRLYSFAKGFDRLTITALGNFPFVVSDYNKSEIHRHLTIPYFEKNSLKGVYSIPLHYGRAKFQVGYKYLQDLTDLRNKYFIGIGDLFGAISIGLFRVSTESSTPQASLNALKIKFKQKDIDYEGIPEGSHIYAKFQHDLLALKAASWHLKLGGSLLFTSDLLPSYTGIEVNSNFVVANYDIQNTWKLSGFRSNPAQITTSNSVGTLFVNLTKFNFYNVPVLRSYSASLFGFHYLEKKGTKPPSHDFGIGVEKRFGNQGLRGELFYMFGKNSMQLRFASD